MADTDKAFDMLPYVVDAYEKLDIDNYIKEKRKEYKENPVSQNQAGIDLFKYILRNAAKIKIEIISIVAVMQDKTPEEVAKQDFMLTVIQIKNLLTDKEKMDFFEEAVQ